ncbi:hypothetical protein ACTZJY_08620 [Escherichia coli]|nr:hypothetical protein [Escherichia coli]
MSFTDNWSDEEFIRQMKELIGNEGDIHVTCNHSEGEQVTETHVHAESSLVALMQWLCGTLIASTSLQKT